MKAEKTDHKTRYTHRTYERSDRIRFQKSDIIDQNYGAHLHDEFVINLTVDGSGIVFAHDKEWRYLPGRVSVMSPYLVHSAATGPERRWSLFSVYVGLEEMHELIGRNHLALIPKPALQITDKPGLVGLCKAAIETLNEGQNSETVKNALSSFAREFFKFYEDIFFAPDKDYNKLISSMHFINNNYGKNISVEEIAREVRLSPNYFIRVFKNFFGVSPHQYLMARRLAEATRLLRTDLQLSQIASKCGFYDQSHFIDQFKRVQTITPSDYRNRIMNS